MARYINLTPHSIDVYTEMAFQGLRSTNPTTWLADLCYTEQAVGTFPTVGCARISTKTVDLGLGHGGIPMVATEYGEAVGLPDDLEDDDILIVSLPMLSMMKASGHPRSHQCVSPYKVVRDANDTSKVLGCMGFSK
jgi:hypothetical protein